MAEQLIILAPGEGLPGFPAGHGPGDYLVDYELRTIRPVPVVSEEPEPQPEAPPQEENQGG